MSSLLQEAIVDAKALRETALKNAEAAIVEKYSDEFRKTLDQLLEQDDIFTDDPAADEGDEPEEEPEEIAKNIPLASTDGLSNEQGQNLSKLPEQGESVEFNVDLDALQEAISNLEQELNESEEYEFDESELVNLLSESEEEEAETVTVTEDGDSREKEEDESEMPADDPEKAGDPEEEPYEEGLDLDSLVDAITEKLTVDMGADLAGWPGRSNEDMKHQMEKELAHRRSTDVEEELKDLKKAQEELFFENKQLKEQNKQYKQATNELKEGLQDVNLSNARLLYTNRVLRNTSLNERQKDRIVEAISRAGSVTEARTIFDTLQSTAESTPKRGPQSLSEAINRRSSSSVIRASRHSNNESTSSDPFSERMKRLAGIK